MLYKEGQKLENVQLLRVVACAMVLTVHLGQRLFFEGALRTVTDFGAHGVYLFFIISGFLIANSYYSYGHKCIGQYFIRRMIKILPLYYTVILIYFVVHCMLLKNVPEDPTGFGWLRYLFLLHGVVPAPAEYSYFWQNLGITWTIPYFLYAYLTFPFLLKWVKDFRSSLVFYVLLLVVSRKVSVFNGWLEVAGGMAYFAGGVALFHCLREGKQCVAGMLLCILTIWNMLFDKLGAHTYSFLFMLLFLVTEKMQITNPRMKKILETCDYYSYTVYLAHGIVFILILDKYEMPLPARAIVAITGTVFMTALLKHYAEIPIQTFLYTHMKKQKSIR